MSNSNLPRVLCVDDEANVLSGLKRRMRSKFNITTACGPEAGLVALKNEGPFDVIVSDFRMPGMDGATFLSKAEEIDPTATRILLTGEANVNTVQSAINQGHVYKVLLKPCSTEDLRDAMYGAIEEHKKQATSGQVDELLKSLAP